MSDKFTFNSAGQMHELEMAFDRNGWQNSTEIKKLSEGDFLSKVRSVLLGHAEIKMIEHLIDCDADPFVPQGWKVEEHKKGGQLKFDQTKVELHLSKNQKNGKYIEGNKLRKELANEPVLNANVLDCLLANQHLIQEEWKGKAIFFWGTIYRNSLGYLYVRCLCFSDSGWYWDCDWLGSDFSDNNPAALLAS